MRYFPHTREDVTHMLNIIGKASLEELHAQVPAGCRRRTPMQLPTPLSEWALDAHMADRAAEMAAWPSCRLFVGAGSYAHYIPAVIPYLLGRSEFATAYTPYQPEISQGTLQAVYEYQTLTARLLGMDVANASLYDGASALAEALLMAVRVTGRKRVALSATVHPHYRQVAATYLDPFGCELVVLPYNAKGFTDVTGLGDVSTLAALAVQSPNFFGCIEPLETLAATVQGQGVLLVSGFSEALAYGLLKNPGCRGGDIVWGEGQSLGIPQSHGGPGLGMLACRKAHVRSMPGRLVGQTTDNQGRRGFVLTLATREQHIRREKATSNICTNSSLNALAAGIFMATMGPRGIRELAQVNHDKAAYLHKGLVDAGTEPVFSTPFFNEFVMRFPKGFEKVHRRLLKRKTVAGLSLAPYYPELKGCFLMCATESHSKSDMDELIGGVKS